MKNGFCLLFCLIYTLSFAQKHDYNWTIGYSNPTNPGTTDTTYPGGGVNIDFNYSPPLAYKINRAMNFSNFCAACSDSSGQLLYYSNGIRIFNRYNELMENGDTINPGWVWNTSQDEGYPSPIGGLSIPKPGAENQYYLFHLASALINGDFNFTPLYYSLIDMNANNGHGKVLEKNVVLLEGDLVRPAAVKHANGRDWWVLTGQANSTVFYRFLITPAGVTGPWEQTSTLEFPAEEGPSICLFSPDGTWYLRCDATNGLNLFSFNRCTGELSNHQFLEKVPGYFTASGSAVFSGDSKYLYVSNNRDIVIQFNLSNGLLSYSQMDTIQQYDLFTDPFPPFEAKYFFGQLGPDQKIYRPTSATTRYMHVTHRPDLPATLCDLENHGFKLPRFNNFTVCYFPNYRLGVWEGSPCDTIPMLIPSPDFKNTSYEEFLEREARISPQKEWKSSPNEHASSKMPEGKSSDQESFDPMNYKHVLIRELVRRGAVNEEILLKPDKYEHK